MIGIIGGRGFIGSAIANALKDKNPKIITRDNSKDFRTKKFDVLINAGGNAKKYLADVYPVRDFRKSVVETHEYIHLFDYKKYIHISTIDVFKDSQYGRHRAIVEDLIRKYTDDHNIIRCCSVIGQDMKKGVLKDILEGKKLRVAKESRLQFITVNKIGEIVKLIIDGKLDWEVITAIGKNNISIEELEKIVNKKAYYISNEDLPIQHYDYQPTPLTNTLDFKTSEEYIKEVLNERME